jgi:hypothetical protein
MSEPLYRVLQRSWDHFTPEHPNRRPWLQPALRRVEVAYTGNVLTVPLAVADRVQLRGLGRPTNEQDWLEPTDWMTVGWSVAR